MIAHYYCALNVLHVPGLELSTMTIKGLGRAEVNLMGKSEHVCLREEKISNMVRWALSTDDLTN